jgi:hypothetical protein
MAGPETTASVLVYITASPLTDPEKLGKLRIELGVAEAAKRSPLGNSDMKDLRHITGVVK